MIMIETIIFYAFLFIIGTFFGSFMTLAVYRIPLNQDILYTHSYCPNCNKKLAFLDLVPVFSYLFLGGKCRYCKEKIRIRYLIYEICSGFIFVLFAMSLKLNILNMEMYKMIYFIFGVLYIVAIFLIAGIDKESHVINMNVLLYGIIVTFIYLMYLYFVSEISISLYLIYLLSMIALMIADIYYVKRYNKYNYVINVLMLCLIMIIMTGEAVFIYTADLTFIIYALVSIYNKIKKVDAKNRPISLYMVIANMISWITLLFIV